MVVKACSLCGENFEGSNRSKYCSKEHYRDCANCGTSFLLTYRLINLGRLTCDKCSREAGRRAQSATMKEKFATGELKGFSDPDNQAKARAALREKYGVENPSLIESAKEKRRQTNLDRFGAESPLSSKAVREKIAATNEERYGVESVFSAPAIQDKIRKTLLERYGVENPTLDPRIRAKQLRSMLENHGVKQPLENAAILQRQRNTLRKLYGVENSAAIPSVREASRNSRLLATDDEFRSYVIESASDDSLVSVSAIVKHFGYASPSPVYKRIKLLGLEEYVAYNESLVNEFWRNLIEEQLGVRFELEGKIFSDRRWRCDLYSTEHRIAIDVNPTISHSTQKCHPRFTPKPTKYHQARALDAEAQGWTLYQIYDWSDEAKVIAQLRNLLGLNQRRAFARNCKIVRPSKTEATKALNDWHLQGAEAVGNIFFGLEHEGELVQVMTFARDRFRGSEGGYELIRLASNGTVVGGASRLFKAFVKAYRPERVKTFASLDTGHGRVYETLGFKFERLAGLNAYYAKPGTKEAIKVTTCSSRFKAIYQELGLSQKEYMNSLGFYRINDAGNKIFVWKNDDKIHAMDGGVA